MTEPTMRMTPIARAVGEAMSAVREPKFMPKKPVRKVSGRKAGDDGELLHGRAEAIRKRRQVDVHRPGQQSRSESTSSYSRTR